MLTNRSRSLRSVSKAIGAYFTTSEIPSESKTSLPQEILEQVDQLLSTSPDALASTDFSKLHEELLRLQQLTGDNNIKDALFLECLSLLAPKLSNADHLEQWFKAYVNPAINSAGHRNDVVAASQKFFLSVLESGTHPLIRKQFENGESVPSELEPSPATVIIETPSQLYFYWIFDLYQGAISKYFDIEEDGLSLAERKRFIAQNAKGLLVGYGISNPRYFFNNLNPKFLQPETRLVAISLASNVVGEHSDTDYSVIAETPFVDSLYKSLLYDNSSTTLHMGINLLSMLIPHIARFANLCKLLEVFGRVASWYSQKPTEFDSALPDNLIKPFRGKQSRSQTSDYRRISRTLEGITELDLSNPEEISEASMVQVGSEVPENIKSIGSTTLASTENGSDLTAKVSTLPGNVLPNGWNNLDQAFGLPDLQYADISPLFTVLYGLYPYSMLSFSNAPSTFLSSINFNEPLPKNWDNYQITMAMKALFPSYSLNPFMTSYTKEQELSDDSRWNRMGSSQDLAVHCLSLHMRGSSAGLRSDSLIQSNDIEMPSSPQKSEGLSQSLLETLEKGYDGPRPVPATPSNGQSASLPLSGVNSLDGDASSNPPNASPTSSRMSSPVTALKGALGSASGSSHLVSYLSPTMKDVDDLLTEHHRLYKRRSNTDEYPTAVPDNISLNDSNLGPSGRRLVLPSATNSPMLKPLSTRDAMISSPLLIAQSEPSSSVTPLTVSSPLYVSSSSTVLQRGDSDADPEPLRLSPLTVSAVPEAEKPEETQKNIQKRIQKQQLIGSNDPTILFYQRELMLLKNEFDFVMYLERHSQYQYSKLLEDRAKDAIYNSSIGDLITANQALRKKVYNLEESLRQDQKRWKTIQNDRQMYESDLLRRNRDMRIQQQDLSRKLSKLEIELQDSQKESNQLFESIIKKETAICEMEFKVSELTSETMLTDTYRKALSDADEKVVSLEHKTANFLSPEESDQASKILSRITELTSARDAAEYSKKTAEIQFRRQISNLQAQIRDYQDKQKNPSSKLTQSFEDYKRSADEQHSQLANAHKDLAERYADLNDEFRKYITAEEVSRNEKGRVSSGNSNSNPKSLLGYGMSPDVGTFTQPSYFPSEPSSSSRSSTSLSGISVGTMQRSFSPTQSQSTGTSNINKGPATASSQVENHTRIRGRGGVQNTSRKKEAPTNPPRSGVGQFRGYM